MWYNLVPLDIDWFIFNVNVKYWRNILLTRDNTQNFESKGRVFVETREEFTTMCEESIAGFKQGFGFNAESTVFDHL